MQQRADNWQAHYVPARLEAARRKRELEAKFARGPLPVASVVAAREEPVEEPAPEAMPELAQDELAVTEEPTAPAQPGPVTIARIKAEVARYYGITVADLEGPRRFHHIAFARQVAAYLSREMTPRSFPQIGRRLGNRDHSTVMHAHRKIGRLLSEDGNVRVAVATIRGALVGEPEA